MSVRLPHSLQAFAPRAGLGIAAGPRRRVVGRREDDRVLLGAVHEDLRAAADREAAADAGRAGDDRAGLDGQGRARQHVDLLLEVVGVVLGPRRGRRDVRADQHDLRARQRRPGTARRSGKGRFFSQVGLLGRAALRGGRRRPSPSRVAGRSRLPHRDRKDPMRVTDGSGLRARAALGNCDGPVTGARDLARRRICRRDRSRVKTARRADQV